MKQWELEQMRKLKIVYDETAKCHSLPYGKAEDTKMTELQMAQVLLGYSPYKTRKIVKEYLDILDKNCKYNF